MFKLNENCRSSVFDFFFSQYGHVLKKTHSVPLKKLIFGKSRKGNSFEFPPDYYTYHEMWLKSDKSYLMIGFQKVHRIIQTNLRQCDFKSAPNNVFLQTRNRCFIRFALRLAVFEILHIQNFLLTPILKFQVQYFVSNLGNCRKQ